MKTGQVKLHYEKVIMMSLHYITLMMSFYIKLTRQNVNNVARIFSSISFKLKRGMLPPLRK